MLDLDKAKTEFINYTNKFNKNDKRILGKIEHTIRVANISKQIAEDMKLTEKQIKLAYLIGILHDIGRFEQLEKYDTFSDKVINHAEIGLKILRESEYIRKYIDNNKYDKIIFSSIEYHNKYDIGNTLDEKEMIFTKIIRDADKIDILYEATWMFWENQEHVINNNQEITKELYDQFKNNVLINNEYNKTPLDTVIHNVGLVFDINYRKSFEIIKQNNYINKILDRFDFNIKEDVRKIAMYYINKKLEY